MNLFPTMRWLALSVVSSILLSACASRPSCCSQAICTQPQAVCCQETGNYCPPQNVLMYSPNQGMPAAQAVNQQPIKLLAVGHGAMGNYSQYTHAQQKLMAMRAAQLDAYRNLAEQVYGFRVWGNTAISAFATQNDVVRSYVDAFVRGARVVNMTAIADGNWEATVELEVTPSFMDCLRAGGKCSAASSPVSSPLFACGAAGCTLPSASYVSN